MGREKDNKNPTITMEIVVNRRWREPRVELRFVTVNLGGAEKRRRLSAVDRTLGNMLTEIHEVHLKKDDIRANVEELDKRIAETMRRRKTGSCTNEERIGQLRDMQLRTAKLARLKELEEEGDSLERRLAIHVRKHYVA